MSQGCYRSEKMRNREFDWSFDRKFGKMGKYYNSRHEYRSKIWQLLMNCALCFLALFLVIHVRVQLLLTY